MNPAPAESGPPDGSGERCTPYARTVVYFSHDPMSFTWDPITELPAHAAEVVTDERGEQFITRGGWPAYVGESNRAGW